MAFVVMQQGLEAPSLAQLQKGFQAIPGMVAYDAIAAARDCFGLLARGLDLEHATAMKNSLAEQKFAAEVIDETALPVLPESRMLHRLDYTKEALVIYDPLDRGIPLPWENILLIAAGNVRMVEFKDIQTERKINLSGVRAISFTTTVTDHNFTQKYADELLLEIIVTGGTLRYTINASKCPPTIFNSLGVRRTRDLATNFKLLLRDLLQHTPNAATNRGAESLREDGHTAFHYRSKTLFYDEMIWILWKMASVPPS